MSKNTTVLNIRIPQKLILELDFLIEKKIYKSRSEAIREFARVYVNEQEFIEKENAKKDFEQRGRERW